MPVNADWDLTGKVAILTADRRGWTPSLAAALAGAGADVAVVGRHGSDAEAGARAVMDLGRRASTIAADLTIADDVANVVEQVVSDHGRLDILVNNARVEFGKPFLDVSDCEWQTVMDFNVKSMFLFSQAAGRQMLAQGGGRIVNIGSGLADRGLWNSTVACASQGAIAQFTAALGLEWARHNIRVNAIGAGWMMTDPIASQDEKESLTRYIPVRRKGQPTDLCGLLVYLCSDACDFVTGQMLHVDGGVIAHA